MTRSAQLGILGVTLVWVATLSCNGDGGGGATGPGGSPLPTDLQAATECAENGLEDFGEVTQRFLLLVEKIHDPNKTLPINLVSYSPVTGFYEHYVDLDDDGISEARLNGRVRSSSDLSNGLQPGEAFGARWDVKEPVAPFTPYARGAFGNGVLSFTTVRISLTQMVDTIAGTPGTWGDPTFNATGSCPAFSVTSLQFFLDDLNTRGGVIDTVGKFIPRGDIGFETGDLTAFLFIPQQDDTATVERRTATGTATFRGTNYDCEVDLATGEATLTVR